MEYPTDCRVAKEKTEFLYIAQETLRLLHNKFVEWHEVGLDQEEYDRLPNEIKKKYEFVNSIDLDTLKKFINEDFMTRSNTICHEICVERRKLTKIDREEILGTEKTIGTKEQLKKSKKWAPDVGLITKKKE